MEFLLKEALKTLCGTNQWSYAVFWSISRQNPNNPFGECTPLSIQAEERVHPLINKLMLKKINVAGEGVVGQAAFSGNHQWILVSSYITDSHPPEVQDEIYQQISAGMQTVAVIPVLPHVVVQLGSPFAIMENMGFVNDVKTLIRSLGGAPDALPYESDATKDHAELFQNSGLVGQLSHSLTEEIKNGPHATAFPFQYPDQTWNLSKSEKEFFIPNFTHVMEPECTFEGHIKYGDIGTDMVLSKPNVWQNQLSTSSGLNFHPEFGQENAGYDGQKSIECQIFSGINNSQMELAPTEPNIDEDLSQALTYPEGLVSLSDNIPSFSNEYQNHDTKIESPGCPNVKHLETLPQPSSGDLFDILGVEYKSNLFGKRNNLLANVPDDNTWNSGAVSSKDNVDLCHIYSMSEGISHSGIFSMTDSDHLLDAVVSNGHSAAKQGPDDNNSCMTTLRKINRNPIVTGSSTYGHDSASDYLKSGSLGLPKPLHKAGSLDTGCFRSGFTKDSVSSCSQTTVHGSQISSLVERGTNIKPDTSMSTTYCKRSDEMNKSTRKRLKAGENPRPRPKDRQMIQDRLKELREIVPNGGKCPIDALLERTVKHMCFLQNVTKHADKLKQSRESKLINKQGGQFLKYNFEGGATWGLEVGSQSMVCPIIVEDLSPPRQLLVEMLCEERGFFLEIADFIRGLGLTILKGVMETRNDKIWAQFAVEANRDVTRMEIFMALVPLLEEKTRGNGSLAKTVDSSLMMMHKSFTRATPIPATGRPH